MNVLNESMPRWRLVVLALVSVSLLWTLARRLRTIQIDESPAYASTQVRQSLRRVLLPAPRGRILDRNGIILADNRPSYCIAVYVEELRRPGAWSNTVNAVDARIDALSGELCIARQISRDEIARHVLRRLPLPLLAWRDLDDATLARFAERFADEPGLDIYVQPERVYPHGAAAAHVLGYVGRDRPQSPPGGDFFHYDVMGMKGRAGIEASMDGVLAGKPGGRLITVDVSGYRHSETNRPAVPGHDVRLTIDIRLQETLERLLADHRGAAVAVDPGNGDILALVSAPSFDPNDLSPSIPAPLWRQLNANPYRPLLDRAISGVYPPGSVFKPCVALAALEAGVPPSVTYPCDGVYTLGTMRLRCSARYGHGPDVGLRYALEQSCNPFFCALGVRIGIGTIHDYAEKMGFGRRTGVPLAGESTGLLPDPAWKLRVRNDAWRAGDTANLAIGQGLLLVTPLQVAMYTAALANGGRLLAPRLVEQEEIIDNRYQITDNMEQIRGNMEHGTGNRYGAPAAQIVDRRYPSTLQPFNPSTAPRSGASTTPLRGAYRLVRGGMYDVVNAPKGTGRRAKVPGLEMAAKTGTAEYGSRLNRRKHAWMIAFAPYDNPRIALAVLIEDGDSGGRTAAPIIRSAFANYFGLPDQPVDEKEGLEGPDALEGQESPEGPEGPGNAGVLPEGTYPLQADACAPRMALSTLNRKLELTTND